MYDERRILLNVSYEIQLQLNDRAVPIHLLLAYACRKRANSIVGVTLDVCKIKLDITKQEELKTREGLARMYVAVAKTLVHLPLRMMQ